MLQVCIYNKYAFQHSLWDSVLSVVLLEDLLHIVTLARDIFQGRLKRLDNSRLATASDIQSLRMNASYHHDILRSVQLLALFPSRGFFSASIWVDSANEWWLPEKSNSAGWQNDTKNPQLVEVHKSRSSGQVGWFIMDSPTFLCKVPRSTAFEKKRRLRLRLSLPWS